MKVRESWMEAEQQLAHHSIPDAGLEAEVLLRHAMHMERADFFAALGDQLTRPQERAATSLLKRRAAGEPLAYILGHREFYGLDFCVDPSVLVPRQETELLVDKVLEFSRDSSLRYAKGRPGQVFEIADVGTGSGAIAIAIAHHLPRATVYATDSSEAALQIADINRRRHAVSERVHIRQGDLLEALRGPVDVIVSNPPYLTTLDIANLQTEVRQEPLAALDGGADGLDVLRRLLRQAPSYIRPGGQLLMEIAPQQLVAVLQIGRQAFPTAQASFTRDLMGAPRVVSIRVPVNPQTF